MPSHTTHNTPALRFPGYTGVWEQQQLKTVTNIVNRTDENSSAPIMMITASNGFIDQSERYAYDNTGASLKKYIILHKGELAYNHGASKLRPYGSCFALDVDNARVPFVYHCFSTSSCDPYFLSTILNSCVVEHQLRRLISSGARMDGLLNISYSDYSNIYITLPTLDEQKKITQLLRTLDGLISLHQRQTQKLTELKQGLLQNMFPREGESVPRLRFPGFTTKWKQQQFNDVYTSFPNKMYQVQTSEYHAEGKFIVIDQGTNDIAGYTNREDKVCHQFPCIIFGDHTTNIKYVNEPFVVGADGVKTLKATGDCAFASYNLKVNNVTQQGYKRHFSQLKEINVLCPSLSEQQKIGAFFRQLDDLIHLHEQYVTTLTHLKKGLLQKMFPQD